ncbi:pentapeptide repeat-containing protein [Thiotrichales bacterium 19X7-9]|nr:pentapeptide repeat-containing protein [Thiotrichales bacterium 19X7-9]
MKEYVGLRSWLTSKFVETVLYTKLHRVNQGQPDRTVAVPSLDDAASISKVLLSHNETLGVRKREFDPTLDTDGRVIGWRTTGIVNGKDWNQYDQFVIPINTSAAHNEALILFPGENPKKAIFVDPMGTEISAKRRLELQELGFTNILSVTHQVQQDGFRCGDYTIALVEAILNEDHPENLDQLGLNQVAIGLSNDPQVLNQNRSRYVHEYLLSLALDGVLPEDREVVVSQSLMGQIRQTQANPGYLSPYLSTEPDDSVSRHDADARIRDSLVYRRYFSGDIERMLKYGVSSKYFSELESKYKSKNNTSEDLNVESDDPIVSIGLHESSPKLSETELRAQKVAQRREKISQLESEIESLSEQHKNLHLISIKPEIEDTDKLTLKSGDLELAKLQSHLKNLDKQRHSIEEQIEKITAEICENIQVPEETSSIILSDDLIKQLEKLSSWQETIEQAIQKDSTGLSGKLKPLFRVANEYLAQKKILDKETEQLEIDIKAFDSLQDLNSGKLDLVKRWKLLDMAVKSAKDNYQTHLRHEEEKKSDSKINYTEMLSTVTSKFKQFSQFGSKFGDGTDLERLSYQGLAEALHGTYSDIKSAENFFFKSDSRRLLLESLAVLGIEKGDFKSVDTLRLKLEKIDCNSDSLVQKVGATHKVRSLENLNQFSQHFLDDRLKKKHQQEKIDVSRDKVKIETQKLLEIQRKQETVLKQITSVAGNKTLEENIHLFQEQSNELRKVTEEFKETELSAKKIVNQIESKPKDYLSEKMTDIEKDIEKKRQQLDIESKESFKDEITSAKKVIDQEVESYKKELLKLGKFDTKQLPLDQQLIFGEISKRLQKHHDQLEILSKRMNDQFEICKRELDNSKASVGDFYKHFSNLKGATNILTAEINQTRKEISQLVFWLAVNVDKNTILGINIDQLDFEGIDLRAANLTKVNETSDFSYDYSQANYDGAILGVVSRAEIEHKLTEFKKAINRDKDKISDVLLDIKTKEVKWEQYKEAWSEHFSFYPILDDSKVSIQNNLIKYLSLIEQKLIQEVDEISELEDTEELKITDVDSAIGEEFTSTKFPFDMDDSDFSKAIFAGRVHGISFRYAKMPKDLRNFEFNNCILTNADFKGCQVNEYTKLSRSANNLSGLTLDRDMLSRKKHFSLAGHIIDGYKDGVLPKDLRGLDLSYATICNIDLSNYIIDETTIFDHTEFRNVTFKDCKINKATFEGCIFEGCEFTGKDSELSQLSFRKCTFNNGIQFKTDITKSEFLGCSFQNCQFGDKDSLGVKIDASFKDSKFLGFTEVASWCDMSSSVLSKVHFEDIELGALCTLPKDGAGTGITVDEIDQNSFAIKGSVFSNSDRVKYTYMSADQFINLFDDYISRLSNSKESTATIRKNALEWVTNHIDNVGSLDDKRRIFDTLNRWSESKYSKSSSNDYKWRLFNHYRENTSWMPGRKKIKKSATAAKIFDVIGLSISKDNAGMAKFSYTTKLKPDMQCFQVAFQSLLTDTDIDNLKLDKNIPKSQLDVIRKVRNGFAKVDLKAFAREMKANTELDLGDEGVLKVMTSSIKSKDLNQDVKRLKSITKNRNNTIDAFVYLLTESHSDKIDQVVDVLKPTELLRILSAVQSRYRTLKPEVSDLKALNSNLSDVKIAMQLMIQSVILETAVDLLLKDKKACRYFLELITDLPVTKRNLINKDSIEKFLKTKDLGDLEFTWNKEGFRPDEFIEYINEFLLLFDDKHAFHNISKDHKVYQKVKDKFLEKFDSDKISGNKELNQLITNHLQHKYSSTMTSHEIKEKANRLVSQLLIGKEPPKVGWPASLQSKFEGKDEYKNLQDQMKEWARAKALDSQIDKFVKSIILSAASDYYKNSADRKISKVKQRFGGLKSLFEVSLHGGDLRVTYKKKMTLADLNQIMASLQNSRGRSSHVDRSEIACKRAIEKHANDPEIFKPISGNALPTIKINGELTDKTPVKVSLDDYNLGVDDGIKSKGLPSSVNGKLKILKNHLDSLERQIQKLDKCKIALKQASSKTSVPESSGVVSDLEHDFKVSLMALGIDGIVHGKSSGDGMLKTSKKIKEVQKRTVKSISSLKTRIKSDIESLAKRLPSTHFDSIAKAQIEGFAKGINKSSTYNEIALVYKKVTQAVNEGFGLTKRSEPISLFQSHDSQSKSELTRELV